MKAAVRTIFIKDTIKRNSYRYRYKRAAVMKVAIRTILTEAAINAQS